MEQARTAGYYLFQLMVALLLPLLLLLLAKLGKLRVVGGAVDDDKKKKMRLPPGPWRLPVIGSLHHLLGKPLAHRAMADLARRLDAPLMYLKLGEVPVVVATSPAAAREVMRTHDAAFGTRPQTPTVRVLTADGQGLVFAPHGDLWRRVRRVCILELLSARRVRSFRRVREDEASRLVAAVAVAASATPAVVNVSQRISELITDAAVRTIIGGRFSRRDEFLELLEEGLKLVSGFSLADLFPSSRLVRLVTGTTRLAYANHKKAFELMDAAIKQHQERKAANNGLPPVVEEEEEEDLLDVLLRIQKEDEGGLDTPLTMGTIKAVVLDLFSAGSETSATTLQWAMSELMRNPDVMKRAQDELRSHLNGKPKVTEDDLAETKYLNLVIKETLRLHPPAPLLIPRESMEPCEVLGYDVPRGATVLVNAWAIARDPEHWGGDAEEFRPERFERGAAAVVDFRGADFEYVPFGAGRRICPGMAFAMRNMELPLAALLYHFDWELVADVDGSSSEPSELDMAEEMGITVRRKNDLLLHPVVRVPPPQPSSSSSSA